MSMSSPMVVAPYLIAWILYGCSDARNVSSEPCRTCPTLDHATQTDHIAHQTHSTASATVASAPGALGARIAAAPAYARIVVPAGVYREPTIIITKPVELVGEAGAILDGEGARTVLAVQADDVTVSGFTIRNTGSSQVEERAGIKVSGVKRCQIEKSHFVETAFGVYLEQTSGCVVQGNMFHGTGATQSQNGNGIHAWSSDHVTINDNRIGGHRDGVYFEFVSHGHVHGNVSERNTRYGLHFMFSNDCEYEKNTYRENGNGVAVMYSARVGMWNNTFDRNLGGAAYGLLLKDINESTIVGNDFTTNTVGLHLEGASRNKVVRNAFRGNGVALRLLANAQDNVLEHNDFVGNAFDVATNSRASYSKLRGNFWDRYKGYDLDRDGVGDVPHAPVTLFGLVVEQSPSALVLLRSPFVGLLDLAERAFPSLTPALRDDAPSLQPVRGT
jgi:nitrous oxidase accessory protein